MLDPAPDKLAFEELHNQDIEEYQENFNPRFDYNEDEDDADAVTKQVEKVKLDSFNHKKSI